MRIWECAWVAVAVGLFGPVVMASAADGEASASVPASNVLSVISGPAGVTLNWSDFGPDAAYVVEIQDLLSSGLWQPAPASVWPVNSFAWTDPQGAGAGARFYRISASFGPAERGKLLSVSDLRTLSIEDIQSMYAEQEIPLAPEQPVRVYKLEYETVNPFNLPTIATGLVVIPQDPTNALALVSYQHGTIVSKSEVPSAMLGLEPVIGIVLGTSGYVAALPDFIGLGDSPGLHPFVHSQSEAAAAIDLLRAVRAFCASKSVALNGQLFLMGYSQGGHATMATHRALETFHTNEFIVTASAPEAGPYDLSGTMFNDFLSDRPMPNPYYFAYLVVAYQSIYHVAGSLSAILMPPYDRTLPTLFDGEHSSGAINRAMGTSVPHQTLRPEFLDAFKNDPNHPMRVALRENDVYDWTPRAPMHLYHCGLDEDVLIANSQVAYDTFVRRGATQVELIGGNLALDHGTCAPITLLAAKLWFDTLRVK